MNAKWCIATYARPKNFDEFVEVVKSAATEGGLTVLGYIVGHGRNCHNHGVMLSGDEADQERFIAQITMALMPSKYSRCSDNDDAVNEGVFANYLSNLGEQEMFNPVHCKDGKWYFYDETSNEHGPFNSAYEAAVMLDEYAFYLRHESSKVVNDLRLLLMDIEVVLRYSNLEDYKRITDVSDYLLKLLQVKG